MPTRESEVIEYSKDDIGKLKFPRKGMIEIHTVVKSNAQAYVKRGLENRKVIILVLPEDENSD